MVKIRLQRQGKKKAPFYHIVVADSRSPRDGKIIEQLGTYDPMTDPATIKLDKEKVEKWIKNGAKPTDTVKDLIEKCFTPPQLTYDRFMNVVNSSHKLFYSTYKESYRSMNRV